MSQPPYSPDPNQPGYEQQPYGAAPPPPAGYGQPAAARPGSVTGAAVIGIVVGALSVLGNLLGIAASFDLGVVPGLLALVSLVIGGFFLFGGIQAMNGKNGQLLVQAAGASIVLSIITLLVLLTIYDGFAFVGLISLILPIVIIMLMRQQDSRQWFQSRGAPTY
ncbi:hypothetical protein BH18ACT7_BH18ACT7_16300 [soil metagenome]